MVIHIALEGIDGVGKTTMTHRLYRFFTKKGYTCRTATQPINTEVISILNNYNLATHEIALLMAFDRSFTYYSENWETYDLVIWDRSILSSFVYNTDKTTNEQFIKDINRYFPSMDLYIVIESDKILTKQDYTNTENIITKYQKLIAEKDNVVSVQYIEGSTDEVFESIVKKCFEYLPRCNWCGRIFTKTTKNKKYCSKKCRKNARREQNRENNRNYYDRYKEVLTERQKNQLGSKGANLHGKADKDIESEKRKVKNAMRSIGLKSRIK